uniref:MULE transposase domain-containing protein n=1 Tax=Lactuca sativa TaxID=4236 RepID=A0A9R1UIB6_LACSA|nr:hypothetical protein LSAT_V11C900471820 [Lactuca sativa]
MVNDYWLSVVMASWMCDEHSFKIMSLITDHTCARNFKLGSNVDYRWIGSHFTREVLEIEKLNGWRSGCRWIINLDGCFLKEWLIESVKELFLGIEHRQCARHVVSNFKKKFIGAQYEKLFWKASKASTEPLLNVAMKEEGIQNHGIEHSFK